MTVVSNAASNQAALALLVQQSQTTSQAADSFTAAPTAISSETSSATLPPIDTSVSGQSGASMAAFLAQLLNGSGDQSGSSDTSGTDQGGTQTSGGSQPVHGHHHGHGHGHGGGGGQTSSDSVDAALLPSTSADPATTTTATTAGTTAADTTTTDSTSLLETMLNALGS